jgi:hypothetical protein
LHEGLNELRRNNPLHPRNSLRYVLVLRHPAKIENQV